MWLHTWIRNTITEYHTYENPPRQIWVTLTGGIALNRCVISVAPCWIPRSPSFRSANECPETYNYQEFDTLTVVAMKRSIFWDIRLCSPLKVKRRFGGTWVDFRRTIWCYIPEDPTLYSYQVWKWRNKSVQKWEKHLEAFQPSINTSGAPVLSVLVPATTKCIHICYNWYVSQSPVW
jgi:hypothetical protein